MRGICGMWECMLVSIYDIHIWYVCMVYFAVEYRPFLCSSIIEIQLLSAIIEYYSKVLYNC